MAASSNTLLRKLPRIQSYYVSGAYDTITKRRRQNPCSFPPKYDDTHRHFGAAAKKDETSAVVDVSSLASEMRHQVRNYTNATNEKVKMVGILADGPGRTDAETYSAMISATFANDGLDYAVHRCPGDRPRDVEAAIRDMNHCRPDVHGVLVFYPIFHQRATGRGGGEGSSLSPVMAGQQKGHPRYFMNPDTGVYYKTIDDYLRDCVISAKDVEGVSHDFKSLSHRQLFRARGHNRLPNDVYIPCTVTAVLKILETYHLLPEEREESAMDERASTMQHRQRWKGCTVTVVNRSTILGRPLAALLALEGATVYSVDENSIIQFRSGGGMQRCRMVLTDCLLQSSVVVTAVPTANFQLDSSAIADYTTVVDISEHSNVDRDALLQKRGIRLISSVGKVTVAALEHNLIRLHRQQQLLASTLK